MTTEKDTGGAAFPSSNDVKLGDWQTSGHRGMTLRDYFAAAAMTGILSGWKDDRCSFNPLTSSVRAYAIADAMIAERSK